MPSAGAGEGGAWGPWLLLQVKQWGEQQIVGSQGGAQVREGNEIPLSSNVGHIQLARRELKPLIFLAVANLQIKAAIYLHKGFVRTFHLNKN